ncbi:MAG: enoyl-CoA hydratase-related protein [Alphaproteobacteria bacterium]
MSEPGIPVDRAYVGGTGPDDPIVAVREGWVATIVLNRPEKRNAISLAMYQRLGEVVEGLSADDTVRCVVVRGAGDKAFAAGADIGEFGALRTGQANAESYDSAAARSSAALAACRHPVVALIQGVCVGGGLELAARCDIRVCGASARFGMPVRNLGLTVDHGELEILLRLARPADVLELLLEGRLIGAEEARHKGLVNRVVPDADVERATYAVAKRIAEGAPLSARWHRKFVYRLLEGRPLTEEERREPYLAYDTEDYRIGCEAFLHKVKPAFKGR